MSSRKIHFTSDLHFGHANVIKYCKRPFSSVDEMDAALIENWNNTVGQDDHIYILGDMFFCGAEKADAILKQLNGVKTLVYGNHDRVIRNNRHLQEQFAGGVHDVFASSFTVETTKVKVVMCHFAMRVWDHSHYGSLHLYGHSHGMLPDNGTRSMDVGVDAHSMTPISLERVVDTLGGRPLPYDLSSREAV